MLNPNDIEVAPTHGRRTAGKRRYWIIVPILLLFCTAYWVKVQLNINAFSSMSISSYFPFKYLINDVLIVEKPGVVISKDFDHSGIFDQWTDARFRDDTKVVQSLAKSDLEINSQCLQIVSESSRRWVYAYAKYIAVSKGDSYQFKGLAHLAEGSEVARFRIVACDADKKPFNWHMSVKHIKKSGAWVSVEKTFKIVDDKIRYLRFELTGGRGVYRFDNLLLEKLKGQDSNHS